MEKDLTELKNLFSNAKQKIEKAQKLLSALSSPNATYQDSSGVKEGLDAIQDYLKHADEIVNWIKNSFK